jgi:hypothetical protein
VVGEVGITIAPYRKLLTVILFVDAPIFGLVILGILGVFGRLAIGIGFFLVLLYLVHVIQDIQHQMRLASVRMHWHIGDIFGIRDEGPLPVDEPPAEIVERAS